MQCIIMKTLHVNKNMSTSVFKKTFYIIMIKRVRVCNCPSGKCVCVCVCLCVCVGGGGGGGGRGQLAKSCCKRSTRNYRSTLCVMDLRC